jgi:hypothetical protein
MGYGLSLIQQSSASIIQPSNGEHQLTPSRQPSHSHFQGGYASSIPINDPAFI